MSVFHVWCVWPRMSDLSKHIRAEGRHQGLQPTVSSIDVDIVWHFPLYQNPFNVLFVSSYWCFNRLTHIYIYIYIHTYICTWRYARTYIHTNIEVDINWYNINMSVNTWKHKQAPQILPALRCGTKRWQLNSWASHRLFVILSFAIMLSWACEIITSRDHHHHHHHGA